ncbi:MAG: PilT/PilU family type 4a pilus ATPase [Candidatus Competibacteraceae bacterium]|nr:PilT/PilU family type 4a pilus ATPase [Candidatus Competibacteraceae bacterium]MCB1812327.1 PilT/PilU family type 4a pilus ATPase [Candidatus Competibacteraceae bacterium]
MDFKDYLKILALKDGSDLYLSTGLPPSAKFNDVLTPLDREPYPSGKVKEIAYQLMDHEQILEFESKLEMNLAISEPNIGRFRVNIFRQRNEVSMVVRNIKTEIPYFKDLGLPSVLTEIVMEKRGLVLFVGGTGSGKSTSLAALIDHRNSNSAGHIITIEDPIEYVHRHKKSVVNQREVGVDTLSYADALKNTLRQAPDVILIGEVRDRPTMEHALQFAETGHLAISTLHANSANQALDRIINFFPEERRPQLLNDLAANFKAIICQRLVPTVDGKRAAALEILRHTPTIEALIRRNEISEIKEAMEKSVNSGMLTMDDSLLALCRAGRISEETAIKYADSANNVRLKLSLSKGADEKGQGGYGLNLQRDPAEEERKAREAEEAAKKANNSGSAIPGGIDMTSMLRPN